MPLLTKTISLELEVTISYTYDPAEPETGSPEAIQDFELVSIQGLTPLLQLNGPHKYGRLPDGTVGAAFALDEFNSVPGLSAKAWINWSEEIEEELRSQFLDDIYEAEADRGG